MRKHGRFLAALFLVATGLLFAGCNNKTAPQNNNGGGSTQPPNGDTLNGPVVVIVEPPAGASVVVGDSFDVRVTISTTDPLAKVEYNFCNTGWKQVYPSVSGTGKALDISAASLINYPINFRIDVPEDVEAGTCTLAVRAEDQGGRKAEVSTVVRVVEPSEEPTPPSDNPPAGIVEGIFNFAPMLPLDANGYVKFFHEGKPVLNGVRFLAQNIDGKVYSYPYIRGKVKIIVDPAKAGHPDAVRVQLKLYRTTSENATGGLLIGDAYGPFIFDFDTTPQGTLGVNWNEYEGEPLRLVAEIYTASGGSYVTDTIVVIDNTGPDSPMVRFYGVPNDEGKSAYVANVCGTQADWVRGTALLSISNIEDVEDFPQTDYAAGIEGFIYAAVPYDKVAKILSIRDDQRRALAILKAAIETRRLEYNSHRKIYEFDSTKYPDGHYAFFAIAYDRVGNAKPSLAFVDLNTDNTPPEITLGNVYDTSPLPFPAEPGYLSDWINIESAATDSGIGFETSQGSHGDLMIKFGDFVDGTRDAQWMHREECRDGHYVREVEYNFIDYHVCPFFLKMNDYDIYAALEDMKLKDDVTGYWAYYGETHELCRLYIEWKARDDFDAAGVLDQYIGHVGYDTNGNTRKFLLGYADLNLPPDLDFLAGYFPEIEDGEYYLEVVAVDALGNESRKKFGPYYVDNTDPTARIELVEERNDRNNNGIPDYFVGSELGVEVQAYDGFSGLQFLYAAADDYNPELGQTRQNKYFASPVEIYGHIFESVDPAPADREFEQGFRWFAIDPRAGENSPPNQQRLLVMAVDKAGNATLYMTNPFEIIECNAGPACPGAQVTVSEDPKVLNFDAARRYVTPGLLLTDAVGIKYYETPPYPGEGNLDESPIFKTDEIYRVGATFAKPVFATSGVLVYKPRWDAIVEWQTDAFFEPVEQEDFVADPTIYDDVIRRAARRNETTIDNNNYLYSEGWLEVDEEATKYPAFLGQEAKGTVGISPFVYMYGSETQDEQQARFINDFTPGMVSKIFGGHVDAVGIYFHDKAFYNMVYELTQYDLAQSE